MLFQGGLVYAIFSVCTKADGDSDASLCTSGFRLVTFWEIVDMKDAVVDWSICSDIMLGF